MDYFFQRVLFNNNIKAQGALILEKLNWNTEIFLDDLKYGEKISLSGTTYINSPFLFQNIEGQFDLFNIQSDLINISKLEMEYLLYFN